MQRLRAYLRRTLIAIAALVGILAGVVMVFTHTARFRMMLRDQVVSLLRTSFVGTIGIEQIEGSIWGDLVLRNVTLGYQGEKILTIPRLEASYALFPLIRGQVRVSQLAAENMVGSLRQEKDSTWNLLDALKSRAQRAASTSKSGTRIYLRSAVLHNATFEITPLNGKRYSITNAELDSKIEVLPDGLDFLVRNLAARLAAPDLPNAQAQAELEYQTLSAPPSLTIKQVRLQTQRSRLRISGNLKDFHALKVDATLSLDRLAAADLASVIGNQRLQQDISGQVRITGRREAMNAALTVAAGPARVAGKAQADLSQPDLRYNGGVSFRDIDFARLTGDKRFNGVGEGWLTAKGVGTSLDNIEGTGNVRVHEVEIPNWRVQSCSLNANLKSRKARFRAELTNSGGRIVSDGEFNITAQPTYRANFSVAKLDLSKLETKPGVTPTDLNLKGQVDGRGFKIPEMNTQAQVDLAPSWYGKNKIDSANLQAGISNQQIRVVRAVATAANLTASLQGDVGLADRAPTRLAYTLRSSDISPLLQTEGHQGGGELTLNGHLGGDFSNLEASGNLTFASLKVDKYGASRAIIKYDVHKPAHQDPYGLVSLETNDVQIGAKLKSFNTQIQILAQQPRLIRIAAQAADYNNHRDSIGTDVQYAQYAQSSRINGTLYDLTLQLADGTWRLYSPVNYSQDLKGFAIQRLVLANLDQQLKIEGNFARSGPQQLSLMLSNFNIAGLKDLFAIKTPVGGTLTVQAQVAGTADAPLISLRSDLNQLQVAQQHYAGLAATLNYASQRMTMNVNFRQDTRHALTADGSLPMALRWSPNFEAKVAGDVDLKVYSPGLSLAFLEPLSGEKVRDVQGDVIVNAYARGPVAHPTLSGNLQLNNGAASVRATGVRVTAIGLNLEFATGSLRLTRLSAQANDGSLNGNANLELRGFQPASLQAQLSFNHWPAIHTTEYQADIDGQVSVSGPVAAPRIIGRIDVLDATLKPDLSALSVNQIKPDPTIKVVGREVSQAEEGGGAPTVFQDYSMNLTVNIHRNAWIKHPNANVELAGEIQATKQLKRPLALSGTIETVHGWVQVENRRFTLTRGVISLTGAPTPDPSLDIAAQYRLREYLVEVDIGGTAKKPTIKFQSQPQLEQADIMSLLLFGKPSSELSGGQQNQLQQQATNLAGGFVAGEIAQSVSSALGLDSAGIDVSQVSIAGQSSLGLGHYIGENIYVSASQGLAGQGEKVSIDYYLTRDLSITTSTTYGKGSASGTGASGTSANNNEIGLSWHRIY